MRPANAAKAVATDGQHPYPFAMMFQSFDAPDTAEPTSSRVTSLRAELSVRKIAAYIVPRADEHQGEYVPACAERLHWISGFSGSAGMAAITAGKAALFVDGRYTLQASGEVDTDVFEVEKLSPGTLAEWLAKVLKHGDAVGYDPGLLTIRQVADIKARLVTSGIKLKPITRNLIDHLWGEDRPPPPKAPVRLHQETLAGEASSDKIARIQADLKAAGNDAAILTEPTSIAWLFNIRGGDIPHTPVALAFAILHQRAKPELFITPEKLDKHTRDALKAVCRLKKPADLDAALAALRASGKTVRLDPASAADRFARALSKAQIAHATDPCAVPKARKNATEIAGARNAHIRDGAAVVRFLHWLDETAPTGTVDEIAAAEKLEALRAETGELREISFDTIAGSGPHGAIVHYRVNQKTNRTLKPGELFLIDSGAQYADGTTDITRTVAIGTPTEQMVRDATLVLKGHIAIATARFPHGTRGLDLDPFARRALWAHGLDYDHGTGHGVGSYLSVHEGPASISRAGAVPLDAGMILSNEPGLYRTDLYGIRLENLVLVIDISDDVDGDRETYGFETLTLAPFDRRLIDKTRLSADEIAWLDAYHARVLEDLSPQLDSPSADGSGDGSGAAVKAWLEAACAPL